MIYDSIRQAKPTIRNTFGAGRLNTRLSFFFFEINRLSFIQKKNFHHMRLHTSSNSATSTHNDILRLESLDSTLFSYRFFTPVRSR